MLPVEAIFCRQMRKKTLFFAGHGFFNDPLIVTEGFQGKKNNDKSGRTCTS